MIEIVQIGVVGGLEIFGQRGEQRPPTLLVLVHGWRGNTTTTWGNTKNLLLKEFHDACDVALFAYGTGLWRWGGKGVKDLCDQLSGAIRGAATAYSYQQVGVAGHSLGGLVAAQVVERLLREGGEPTATGLLCVGTPWKGVLTTWPFFLGSGQLHDLRPSSTAVKKSNEAWEYAGRFVRPVLGRGRGDSFESAPTATASQPTPDLSGARTYWTYVTHGGACAARDEDDEKLKPFQDFAEEASKASTLRYLRALEKNLEDWRIHPISTGSAENLYEQQSASPWKATTPDDPEQPTAAGPSRRRDGWAESDRLDDVLYLLDSNQRCVCLTGEGGAGKTTSITELARLATERALNAPRGAAIPVVLRLGPEAIGDCRRELPDMLAALAGCVQVADENQRWCRDQTENDLPGRLILLVDGLDEAHKSQRDLVDQLSRTVSHAGGGAILAGRPESVSRDLDFTVLRLDALDPERVERIVHRQLGNHERAFLKWIPAGFQPFLANPGQLEMTMWFWHRGGHEERPPTTLGELYERALPYCLGRPRGATTPPPTSDEDRRRWHECAARAKTVLPIRAFADLEAITGGSTPPGLDPGSLDLTDGDCELLQNGGIIGQSTRRDGTRAWGFASARWREFFASLELRRLAEVGEWLGDVARPTWLNVWRMAATPESNAVERAAEALSPLLQTVVAVSRGSFAADQTVADIGWRQRRLLADVLQDTPGYAALIILLRLSEDWIHASATAIEALKGTTDRLALAAIIRLCEHPHYSVRANAALTLQGTTDPDALACLLRLCEDTERAVRSAVARALQGTKDAAALAALLSLCEDTDLEVRKTVALSLHGTTEPTLVAALIRLSDDPKTEVREAAAQALRGTTDRDALAALLRLCEDTNERVRWDAASALRGTTDTSVLAALVRLCEQREGSIRESAVYALRATRESVALAALVRLCEDAERGVRRIAASGLEGTTDPAALGALLRLCEDTASDVREAAASALAGTTNTAALAALIRLCEHGESDARLAAALALEGTTDPTAFAALLRLCEHGESGARVAATLALWGTTDTTAIVALIRRCSDTERDVREAALWTLQGTTDPAAIPAFVRLCDDTDSTVRCLAAEALKGTTDRAALAALVRLCEDTESDVRWVAAEALKGTTDRAALAALVRSCEDIENNVRWAAAEALEGTTDRAALAAMIRLCKNTDATTRHTAALALRGTRDPAALAALVRLCEDTESNIRELAASALRSAPPESGVAQLLLAWHWKEDHRSEVEHLLFARVLPEDVPFAEWPGG